MEKFIYLILIIAGLSQPEISKAQNFLWAQRGGGYAFDFGNGVTTDSQGNIYVVGQMELTGWFGSDSIVCAGGHDIFLAKYNPSGNLSWIRRAGGKRGDAGLGISIDPSDNIYITGEIEDTAYFGSTMVVCRSVVNDFFLAKYNTGGELLWVVNAGSTAADKGKCLTTDASGNIFVAGEFRSYATFGSTMLVSANINTKDIFVAKYDPSGNCLWAKRAGSTRDDQPNGITVDNLGNCYVTGHFDSVATFGITTLTSSGGLDIFIAKYDQNGNEIWVKKAGGLYYDMGRDIKYDPAGRILITGEFRYYGSFDGTQVLSSGEGDVFLASYNSDGTFQWVKSGGGPREDVPRSLHIGGNKIYITGYFGGTANFGGNSISASDSSDVLILRSGNDGSFEAAMGVSGGGQRENMGRGICIDAQGNGYVTGYYFMSSADFGGNNISNYGNTDAFLARFSPLNFSDITEMAGGMKFGIYPNPSKNKIHLEFEKEQKSVQVKILNILGQPMITKEIKGQQRFSIDISQLSSGLYFAEIECENGYVSEKFLKE